jgi:hypothetical protein
MSHPAEHILTSVNGLLANLKLMSDRRPDAKIGSAAKVFNSLLAEAKQQFSGRRLIHGMEQLTDQDTVVSYLSHLSVLQGEIASGINEAYESSSRGAIRSRPLYGN